MALRDEIEEGLSGSYTIVRELAGGGMSRVFLAEERALHRKVVLKVLPAGLESGINLERFKREIKLVATLHHPHIVPVFSAGEVAGSPFFSMPFVEGESLRAKLDGGELPIADVLAVLRDVSKALSYAHAHGIVHRDIKPDNILLSAHAASVTDFGVAKALSESTSGGTTLTATGATLGTPAYMAPEQAAADRHIDHRADIYAFGVLAYEMLTGRPPFAGRPASQMLAAHVAEAPVPVARLRESVPAALSSLVDRCLAKRPADRPQTADELLHALEAIGTPQDGVVPASGRRRSQRWIASEIAAVLAVAALVFVITSPRRPAVADSTRAPIAQQSVPPAGSRYRPRRIVVAPFTNMTGDTALDVLGAVTADALTNGLSQLDSISVVSTAASLTDSAGRIRRFAGADVVRTLGRETKASTVVWGTIYRQGDSLSIGGALINVNDGGIELSLEPVKAPLTAANSAIEVLRDQLLTTIDATSLKKRLGTLGRPPNAAAYREFLDGLQSQWYTGDRRVAVAHYAEASRLDPTFVYASYYFVLASNDLTRTANRDTVVLWARRGDSAVKSLERRRSGMTPLELDLLAQAEALAVGTPDDQLRTAKRLLARDSTVRMVSNAALAALDAGRFYEALRLVDSWPISETPPVWTSRTTRMYALHLTGQLSQALAFTKESRRGVPDDPLYLGRHWELLGAIGDSAGLAQLTDSVAAAWVPGMAYDIVARAADAVEELHAHGHDRLAKWYARRELDWFASRPRTEQHPRVIGLLLFLGMRDSAAAVATGYRLSPAARMRVDVSRGDSAWVLSQFRILDSLSKDPYDQGLSHYFAAQGHAVLGHKAQAVSELRAAFAAGMPWPRTMHRNSHFDSLRDYPPFIALQKSRDRP